jgi:glycosyltransferase involved in cell wall biosynthesis
MDARQRCDDRREEHSSGGGFFGGGAREVRRSICKGDRMRIALFPSAYAPAVGGVEELTARLARRLLDLGEDVEVWTARHPAALAADEVVNGVRVRRFLLPMPRASARALAGFPQEARHAWGALGVAAAEFRPNVIHVQCFSANGAYATWLSRRARAPLVLTLQGETIMDDTDIYDHSLALRRSLRLGLRNAAAVTGCSRFVLDDAERRFGLVPGRGTVIPNGVELSEDVAAQPLSLPFERFVLGLGRVVEKKGFDLLLAAFERLAPHHPDLGLVIGGSGPERDALAGAAAAAGLSERVAFPGTLSRAQVAWAMGEAAVFVLPSRVEPFGIVVVEALRAGCPTIVSAQGGATEIVRDGVDGIVADPRDTTALSLAIDRLLADRDLANRLSDSGRAHATDFDWAAITQRYRELYERVAR